MKVRVAANGTKPFTAEDAEDAEKFIRKSTTPGRETFSASALLVGSDSSAAVAGLE
jgi:hypothetical protein